MEELTIPDIVDFVSGRGVKEYMQRRHAHSLTLETKPDGTASFDVPLFGDVQVLHEPSYGNQVFQESGTVTATPDLASMGLDLCAACNVKVAAFLEAQRKRIKGNESPFDQNGELRPDMFNERMTSAGLLTPEWAENPFVTDAPSLTLGGLRRPDAMPDEQAAQLRELMLSRPAPKQPSRKLSLEQLQALGFVQDDAPVSVPDYLVTTGGLIAPDF